MKRYDLAFFADKELKKIFFRFLKEEGIKNIFFERINRGYNKNMPYRNIFDSLITWNRTKERYRFWQRIQIKWVLILIQMYLDGRVTYQKTEFDNLVGYIVSVSKYDGTTEPKLDISFLDKLLMECENFSPTTLSVMNAL